MNKIAKNTFIVAALLVTVCLAGVAAAEEAAQKKSLVGIEFFTGFGKSKIHAQGNYYLAPFICDLDFDMKPLVEKTGLNYPGLIQFQLEPFINAVYSPDANVEIGNNFMFKIGFLPQDWKFQPYVKAGAGLIYLTQHTREQSTQFNFNEQGVIGAHYFIKKNFALNFDCRIRHVSNASIKQPNHGINSMFYLLGVTYQFD